jgi:formate hydrogenlyase transcriptional activator
LTRTCSGPVSTLNNVESTGHRLLPIGLTTPESVLHVMSAATPVPQQQWARREPCLGRQCVWNPKSQPGLEHEGGNMPAGIGQNTFTGDSDTAPSAVARYEALVRVSEALRAYHDCDTLFRSLARELRPVVPFGFLGLALYDDQSHTTERRVLEAGVGPLPLPVLKEEESLTYWTVQNQEPLVIPNVEDERRFPEAMDYFRNLQIRSTCSLPLTTGRRRVGMLVVGSQEPDAYEAKDVTFLSLVANQVALAIDDALNYDSLQRSFALEHERLRNIETSDELLRTLSTVLDIRQVFPRISQIATMVLPHDLLTFTFHDGHGGCVVQAASDEWKPLPARLKVVHRAPEGAGFAIIDDFGTETCPIPIIEPPGFWDQIRSAGYRSLMAVHVTAGDQQMGVQFWSKQPRAFDERQVTIARRIADHLALAVSHEQLAEMDRQAAEAKLRMERLEARVKSLSDELGVKRGRTVGSSAQWQAVLKAATQVALTDSTVLLVGESGTGKEVVARYIHHASSRATGPFVALNCAALPEQLLESELFGYERGAFTGAQQAKPGQIELAAGGVLFLDEVAEMSPSSQAKFLRVLQEREFQRLGSTHTLKADVRVIAATNRDLKKAMERGDFREDLFYRLQVFDIRLPALRDRSADILPLSEEFLREIGQLFGRPPAGLTRAAKEALLRYRWPGNVRELRNALERAAILCEGGLITAEHLSLDQERPLSHSLVSDKQTSDLSAMEREMIQSVLAECAGNKSKAATRLGISRTQLYVRLRKYRIS